VDAQQIVFLLVLGGGLVLFLTSWLRIDVTAMLILAVLALTGILTPEEALSGFASEPAIIVASVFVMSAGLAATGVTERIGVLVAAAAGKSEWRAIVVLMAAVAALAAFTHHLMVVAMMLPVVMRLARENGLPPSRILMPLSLAASLGTTLTIVSAPAFLLASNLLRRGTGEGLDIFAITPIGACLVVAGILYMLAGRWLLPRRGAGQPEADYMRLDQYYTEFVVEPESPWAGRTRAEFETAFEGRLQVVDWPRRGSRAGGRTDDRTIRVHDVILVRASPDEIASIRSEPGLALHAVAKYGEGRDQPGEDQLVQALVAPNSELVGRTVAQIDLRRSFGVVAVGLWRKEGWIREELANVRLRDGDVLVLWGDPERLAEVAEHRAFLMMVPFSGTMMPRHRWPVAVGIMATAVVVTATELMPAAIAFLAGAVAMVVSGCVTARRAYREVDVRIFVMIAGVVPLGIAIENTGTAAILADALLGYAAAWSPLMVLLAMFAAAALLTQVLSDSATVILLGPVAMAVAAGMGLPPQPFVVCLAMGAVASFLTPIGHHGNLLILNPGQYRFADFLRVGVPLTVLIGGLSAWLARWLWLGGPLLPVAG
jgi:di/tricarboxylate transporter